MAPRARRRPESGRHTGHDAFGSRYSPLAQITRSNVSTLAVAWTYRTGEAGITTQQPAKFEATPLMVDGTLYLSTPFGQVIALDPATGTARWTFDAHVDRGGDWGDFANRGVSTWLDPRRKAGTACRRRLYLGAIDARIIALDAATGAVCRDFGVHGTVNLRNGLRNPPVFAEEYELTSPPAVVGGVIVTGSGIADNTRTNAVSGEVRAYDARTGALRWTWDPIPRDSADLAWSTWRGVMAHTTGAANVWSVIAADSARDLVFVPTTSPSPDYYGGERTGDNRYANSIVALRASTGAVVWSFQTVHHDLWDYDNASPPALVTITHNGRRVDVVLQATKTGQLFVLDRDTGVPVFPVEERAVPASLLRTEHASPTQPFNTVIPPLSPQGVSLDDVWGPTPEIRDACLATVRPLRNEGVFTPPSLQGTIRASVQRRWCPLGRTGVRSGAADRGGAGEHHCGAGSAHPGGPDRYRRSEPERLTAGRSVHPHARHPVRHAAQHGHQRRQDSVHEATLGIARRDRSHDRREGVERTAGRSRECAAGAPRAVHGAARHAQPGRPDHHRRRAGVHWGDIRSRAARVRHSRAGANCGRGRCLVARARRR